MKKEIKIKQVMDAEALSGMLEDLVRSFREGTVVLESGDEFVTLKPGRQIDLEIEAGHKKGKQKISLEMAWRTDAPEVAASTLKISSTVPEMVAPLSDEGSEDADAAEAGEGGPL